jgi:hypothetical protein
MAEIWNQQNEDRKMILQTINTDQTTISCTLPLNCQFKVELQDRFIRLTNIKVELTSTLYSAASEDQAVEEGGPAAGGTWPIEQEHGGEEPKALWSPAATRPVPGPPAAVHGHLPTTDIPQGGPCTCSC